MAHPKYWPQKEEIMRDKFRLTQLYKSGTEYVMGTCHIHDNEDGDRFECTIKGDESLKDALWQFCENNWFGKGHLVEVEFTDVNSSGLPKDGNIVWIYGFSENHFELKH